jgi:hypothetical protein
MGGAGPPSFPFLLFFVVLVLAEQSKIIWATIMIVFVVEVTGNLWELIVTIIVAIAAAVDLGFTGYQLHKNNQVLNASNKQQKESNRMSCSF